MGLAALLQSGGGLVYHLRAERHRDTLWRPFREGLERVLEPWARDASTRAERLLIVGSSAGHCLSLRVLRTFREVAIIEPDPVARWLFQRRFGAVDVVDVDVLVEGSSAVRMERLEALLAARPRTTILFANVLGQWASLRGIDEDGPAFLAEKRRLAEVLARRDWLTFHDRLSGPLAPRVTRPVPFAHRASDEELLDALYGLPATAGPIELVDHLVDELTDARAPHTYLAWSITPTQHHVIEIAGHRGRP